MKGFTTDKQLGKRDGRRYYQQKGVEGIVSASINQGMSSRVKNDAAYANTRLNNAEFGAAGSTAGAITRSLSQKWRYLLVPFAAGKLAKDVRALMMDDDTNKWGQRSLQGTGWQKLLAEKVSQYSKNPVSDFQALNVTCVFSADNGISIGALTDELRNPILESKGCDGIKVVYLAGVINASEFSNTMQSYAAAIEDMPVIKIDTINFGTEMEETFGNKKYKVLAQDTNKLYGGVAVFLPYKDINGEEYIMQELCSFQMVAAEPAA